MDVSRLDKIIYDFYLISGMEISVLDADFHSIAIRRCPGENFCSIFHRAPGALDICKASDIERLEAAKNSQEPLIYTCPCGITEAIVPIIRGDSIVAYLISSMGVKNEAGADEKILEKTAFFAPRLQKSILSHAVSELNHLDSDKIDAYFSMLKMIGERISNDDMLTDGTESVGKLVKYYIKNNLSRKLTLSDIAWNLHCSTVTLTEHFKDEFGITIMEYVTAKRMNLAEKLLLSTDEPLREIAAHVGFSDVEYFSRTFKRYHGMSPAAWRRSNKDKM